MYFNVNAPDQTQTNNQIVVNWYYPAISKKVIKSPGSATITVAALPRHQDEEETGKK